MKFLGVILDENVTWKEHIKLIENKTCKKYRHSLQSKVSLKSKLPDKYLLYIAT